MAEVYAAFGAPELGPGEFTVSMYARKFGLTKDTAKGAVTRALEAGVIVEVGDRMINGTRCKGYRRKADGDD